MSRRKRVLVVDDHIDMARLLADHLTDVGYEVVIADNGAAALALARDKQPDVGVTDLRMAGLDGFDVIDGLRAIDPEIPVIVMTAFGAIDTAVEAMRRGAAHYVTKPLRLDEIALHIARALAERALKDENIALRRLVWDGTGPAGMVGAHPAMVHVFERISRLANANVPVLIRGESGTGKERVARGLHFLGPRRDRPFVATSCASLPANLLESELFGHTKGSFTGATGARRGLFLQADGGTLFLDEIGDMPLELQAHLLRVLEEHEIRPVGADSSRPVDVRVVAATHQPLEQRIAEGKFRADLFYRLDVVPIVLPPLRDRSEDIPSLVTAFLARCEGTRLRRLDGGAMAALEQHSWPGNVRELENLIRRLAILVDREVATAADLTLCAPNAFGESSPMTRARAEMPTLRALQDDYIGWVVRRCDGNKTRAAEVLGVDVSTIHRRERALER